MIPLRNLQVTDRIEIMKHPTGQTGVIIQPPLSQSELASWVDSSRETVARALKLWRASGWITTARRKITVLDTTALRSYADGVPPPPPLADP